MAITPGHAPGSPRQRAYVFGGSRSRRIVKALSAAMIASAITVAVANLFGGSSRGLTIAAVAVIFAAYTLCLLTAVLLSPSDRGASFAAWVAVLVLGVFNVGSAADDDPTALAFSVVFVTPAVLIAVVVFAAQDRDRCRHER